MRNQQITRLVGQITNSTWDSMIAILEVSEREISSEGNRGKQIKAVSDWADEDPTNRWPRVKQALDGLGIPEIATEIAFIIVAMTEKEAEELFDESVFTNEKEKDKFRDFIQALQDQLINDKDKKSLEGQNITNEQEKQKQLKQIILDKVKKCYKNSDKDNREKWKPYSYQQDRENAKTIKEIIDSEVTGSTSAKFYSVDEWIENQDKKIPVVILDSISWYHPKLREYFRDNFFLGRENMALLIISAINPSQIPSHNLIKNYLIDNLRVYYDRYSKDKDKRINFGVLEDIDCQRWIHIIKDDVIQIINCQKPVESQREKVNERGKQYKTMPHLPGSE